MNTANRLPYPGLRSYQRNETDLFFGRESCTHEMVALLAETRFLAVLGSSGSGKSSLVLTGLLDALELGLNAEAGWDWRIADFTPGERPLQNLAQAVVASGNPEFDEIDIDVLLGQIEQGPFGLIPWATAGNLASGQNLLLLVDQFEELFRYGDYAEREQAEAFVGLLLESVSRDAPISVVITLRSEYLGACALLPGLVERINRGLYLTRRMTREECRQAIEGPASVVGFDLKPALVTRLLNDLATFAPWESDTEISQLERISRRADQLPIMQHVLNRLWVRAHENGAYRTLTLSDYIDIGELQGALNQHGTEILESLGSSGAEIAEPVFRSLVSGTSLANAVRLPMRFSELVEQTGLPENEVRRVVDVFRAPESSFLLPSPSVPLTDETVVDISHESLIRQWSTLADWLRQETADGTRWRQLAAEAEAHENGKADLLSEINLAVAIDWLSEVQPTKAWAKRHGGRFSLVQSFVDESKAAVETRQAEEARHIRKMRGLRTTLFSLLSLLLLVSVGGGWGYRQYAEQLAETNDVLAEFKRNSVKVVTDFAQTMDKIQKAEILGFSGYERELSRTIEPFQAYTLNQAPELLSSEETMLFRFTYGRTLARLGEDTASIKEVDQSYRIAKKAIEEIEDPRTLSSESLATFFEIITYHAWNLMNAGDYDAAGSVLEFSASVENVIQPEKQDAYVLNGLASVENTRARWFDDKDNEEQGWTAQQHALLLQKMAIKLDQTNKSFLRKLTSYQSNSALTARNLANKITPQNEERAISPLLQADQSSKLAYETIGEEAESSLQSVSNSTLTARNLANKIKSQNEKRAKELRLQADQFSKLACETIGTEIERSPLSVSKFSFTYAGCIEKSTNDLKSNKKYAAARNETVEALQLINSLLAFDPRLQSLQTAKLRILDQAFDIESAQDWSRNERTIATGEALLNYWIEVVGESTQLPKDYWVFDSTFDTISSYLSFESKSAEAQAEAYRKIRAALAQSLEAFPNAKRYLTLDANAVFKLAETIAKINRKNDELIPLYDAIIANHSKLGTYENYADPSESLASACSGYSGKVRIYKEFKQADLMLATLNSLISRCGPIVERHPWDFYLRYKLLGSQYHAGELLFEIGRYEDAMAPLEYASHWGAKEATRYLAQMYRIGLGVDNDIERAKELDALASRQSMKRFTIPTDFGGTKHPFHVYVREWPEDFPYTGIDDQAKWVSEYRGGEMPPDVIESFRKLHKIARENNVSFPDLCFYALGNADKNAFKVTKSISLAKGYNFASNPAISTDEYGIAIAGFDVVSYTDTKLARGVQEHFSIYDGAVWLFSSSDNRDKFLKDPNLYIPAYGGFCTICLAQGNKVHPKPTIFRRLDGKTFLFISENVARTFGKNTEAITKKADQAWNKLKSEKIKAANPPPSKTQFEALKQEPKIVAAKSAIEKKEYAQALHLVEEAISGHIEANKDLKKKAVSTLGSLSWHAIKSGNDDIALKAAEQALALDETESWIAGNKAHAHMFLGHPYQAREIYMRGRGSLILDDDRLWDEVVLEDFAIFKKLGRSAPLMEEIELIFKAESSFVH